MAGQSADELQPQVRVDETQALPSDEALQSMQAPPLGPHAEAVVPGLQSPPPQHPPLQGCAGVQVVVHRWVTGSQAAAAGQSLMVEQPQLPPSSAATQRFPRLLPAQFAHCPPEEPHAAAPRPWVQAPLAQQPPLQSVVPGPQVVVQLYVPRSQALPAGQSTDEEQPHRPPSTQAVPVGLPRHEPQRAPSFPHAAGAWPGLQRPASQQPPWQALKPPSPQPPTQARVESSHALPTGQSSAALQPASTPASLPASG